MPREYNQSEPTAVKRRFPVFLVDGTDGITPELTEGGGQPQISKVGGSWNNTGGVLVSVGNGGYYVELTAGELDTVGYIAVRYKSANTAEFNMDGQVVPVSSLEAILVTATGALDADAVDPLVLNTNLGESTDGHYDGQLLVMTSGAAAGRMAVIDQYTGASGIIQLYSPGMGADLPLNTNTFAIIGIQGTSPAANADAVWQELLADQGSAGSMGKAMIDLDTNVDQVLSTTESNIRGADSDDLKDISDQIDAFMVSGVPVDMTTLLSMTPIQGSIGEAFLAAWLQGFGTWRRDRGELSIHNPYTNLELWRFILTGPANLPATARERKV
jgi:hypothetical protein